MTQTRRDISLGFTPDSFPEGTHMCYIFNDENQRREVVAAFLDSGLKEGEKVGYFVDTVTPEEMLSYLRGLGVKIPDRPAPAALSVSKAEDTYCPDGTFVPDRMLDTLRAYYASSLAEGFRGSRVSGEMSWALKGLPGSRRLVEYEAKVNDVVLEYPVTAICQYNANLFDGGTLFDVLSVHPMMVVNGQVAKNPYYIQQAQFLKKWHERG
ncbi:MAG: MEDS domain-containing protein [Candidatus Aminicenantes bacterium]|nr:MEDS domain-containing protein [Candidatus Aminicenantes bacterium]